MEKIILYTTHCPRCEVLMKKLQDKNLNFDIVDDLEKIKEKGITIVPMLEINDNILNFKGAVDWINNHN